MEGEVPLHRKNERSDQLGDEDLTDDLVEWAKDRMAAVSETTPGRLGPREGADPEPELHQSSSESVPSGVQAAGPIKPKQQPKVLVVALEESAADRGQAHFFDDSQVASQFIASLVESGLNPDRIIVLRGTPMNFKVAHRPVVTIGEPGQQPTISG